MTCDEHRAEYQRAYREANRDKLAEWERAYREANRDKVAERKRAYYEANRDKLAEYQRAYREAKKRAQVMDGHGTQSSYDAGCRCDICNAEQAERNLSL